LYSSEKVQFEDTTVWRHNDVQKGLSGIL